MSVWKERIAWSTYDIGIDVNFVGSKSVCRSEWCKKWFGRTILRDGEVAYQQNQETRSVKEPALVFRMRP